MKNKKMWGGRFSKKTNPLVEEFTKSIHYDHKIAAYDVMATQIHVLILEKSGYLTHNESLKFGKELSKIHKSIVQNKFNWSKDCEDVHTNIQNLLEKKLGTLVSKLQTARSRNEQVAIATRLYCKDNLVNLLNPKLERLITVISHLSKKNKHLIIPGFTHLQHAQPVYLKDYLLSYAAMFGRDKTRLDNISQNLQITMGAGSLAGTPISVTHYKTILNKINKGLNKYGRSFDVTANSLDAVSDRDFVIEIINALSIIAMHLSRLAEDLILWSTKEFGFIEIDDAYCTGSSLMPQKKNPDVLELIRGNTGRLYGNLVSVLTMMKGLPLTYNRDMQLDKEPLFNSFEIISEELNVLA